MAVNLSVKNVPDPLAERLRARASRNHRSLQRELLSILEAAVDGPDTARPAGPAGAAPDLAPLALAPLNSNTPRLTIEEVAARARELFPEGTESSVAWIRELRDSR